MKFASIITTLLLFFCFSQAVAAEEGYEDERFQAVDTSIIVDSQSGLMWATRDNGSDIEWYDAERYCEDFEAGGYTDWRLPEIKELATLYTKDRKNKDGYFITDRIRLSDCCPWSSDTSMGGAALFSYKTGKKAFAPMQDAYQSRALPVRSTKKVEPHQ